MKKRWASGFTVVELIVVIVVVALVATIGVYAYNSVRKTAVVRSAQSDLQRLATEMQRSYQSLKTYPTTIPTTVKASDSKVTLSMVRSGTQTTYSGLNAVQNGILLSQTCNDLLAEGVGRGVDQGGNTNNYISSCDNWVAASAQITGWETRVWNVPVTSQQFTDYAAAYTVSGAYHKQAQETAVKNFYNQLNSRFLAQGGTYPITSFWDYWANSGNGGVMHQPIAGNGTSAPFYCAQASIIGSTEIWKMDQTAKLQQGAC